MRLYTSHLMKKASVAVIAAAGMAFAVAGPASAAGDGAGAFTGTETAPNSNLILPSALCAEFDPTLSFPGDPASPLVETLSVRGTINGSTTSTTGSVTFTSTNSKYDANPVGTYADNTGPTACAGTPYTVPGTLSVNMGGVSCTSTAGSAGYLRTGGSAVRITGSCTTSGGVTVKFTITGTEEPCLDFPTPTNPCPVVGGDAFLQGSYVQT